MKIEIAIKRPLDEIVMPSCFNECFIKINNYKQCGLKSKRGYHCSRIKGHEGQHVACGIEHSYDIWR